MSISSSIPVLRGDRGTELRSAGEELVLRRPEAELRIPLAAIARVRAERRDLAVELTAPAGAAPTVHRVEDVSAAAASVFADAVNAALPERAPGEETVDGATLVATRSLVFDDEEGAREEDDTDVRLPTHKGPAYAACAAVAILAVVVGLIDKNWGRGIATLLLGEAGVGVTYVALVGLSGLWREWYLPRYGITVDGQQVFRDGGTTNAFTATDGVTRHIYGENKGRPVRIAYHPRNPRNAIVCTGWREKAGTLVLFLVIAAVAGLLDYGTFLLALPAFGG
ncbi:hypothetical protein KV205_04330 [Streptomyces sp. SKN60]|uniref:DUF3592 domain-containing protein n=1 Tax=Streptomyces sp. SKN60 TaxID=2855506 RepID=UPI002247979F|nr:hypothetical protein [Streptomyces sp. SKN60]MCX2179761.1 hypothetical protein [Streptomyces sp. SKN60]